jgi:glyoxylase-like metal-dependent hydrolase (beta-lactamase superfamily II)
MNRRTVLTLGAAAAAAESLSATPAFAARPIFPRIGRYTFAGPGTVNTWWIETERSVIVIDLQRDLPHAREALAAVRSVGKPVAAVLVTHGHPDHYAGLGIFRDAFPGLVAYASAVTQETIGKDHYGFNALLQQAGPDVFPNPVAVPDRVIAPNETLRIDGVTIATREFGKSDANSMTVLYLPATGDLFSGDIILSGMHAFFYEGASGPWLSALDRLKLQFPNARHLYPGHGEPGAPAALIAAQEAYIHEARKLAVDAIGRFGATDAAQAATIVALRRRFPRAGNPVGLPNMLELSTAGLFKELVQPENAAVF